MAQFENRVRTAGTVQRQGADVDQGLRSYMLGVYNYMAGGVALTGLIAYALFALAVTNDPAAAAATLKGGKMLTSFGVLLYTSPLKWVLMFAPLAFVFFFAVRANRMSVAGAQTSFWAYAALVGASISVILLVYTGASIARVFFISSATFAALGAYGYTTKKDLTGWGTFLFMGMIGILIASIVNLIFLQSTAMQFATSVLGVLIFAGFTAYDTQRIKDDYFAFAHDGEMAAKASVFGALALYQDFVGLFMNMLSLMGDRE
ncbi:MAG: Bax inhibitor-1/YccA family protein [Hyphomicrobium sp.]